MLLVPRIGRSQTQLLLLPFLFLCYLSFLFLSFPIYALPFLHRGLSSHITTEQDTFNAQLHGLVGSDINRSYQTLSSYSAI